MKSIFENENPLYIEFMKLIGYYSVTFAFLEDLMKLFINKLLNPQDPQTGFCLTATMGFQAMYHGLMSLYRERETDPQLIAQMETLLNRIKGFDEKRNTIIHSIWHLDSSNSTITRYRTLARFSHGLKPDSAPVESKELERDIEDLSIGVESLLAMLDRWETDHKTANGA